MCGKALANAAKTEEGASVKACTHKCVELCHPGPCPPCNANIKISCPCGGSSRFARCGTVITCEAVCGKSLKCGNHKCERKCHHGPCDECPVMIRQGKP